MPSQILFFDQARSGSHMLVRMLTEKNPDVKLLDHPCRAARGPQMEWLQADDFVDGMKPEVRQRFDEIIVKGTDEWREALKEAEKMSSTLLMHEHLFTTTAPSHLAKLNNLASTKSPLPPPSPENYTQIPTSLLLHPGTIPLLSIRNPQQAAPSAYRVLARMDFPNGGGRQNFLVVTNLIHTRAIYDFYIANGIEPVIVDFESHADSSFVPSLLSKFGLDPAKAAVQWKPATKEELGEMHPMWYASQSSMINSGGFMKEKLAGSLDESLGKWEEEFGTGGAALVKEMVELSMPHYEYLFERRVKF